MPSPDTAPTQPTEDPQHHALILFDGVCNLCNGFVNFVLDRDPSGYFKFGALQSDSAQQYLRAFELDGESVDTVVLIEDGQAYTRSTAALRIARQLGSPWSALFLFSIVPKPIRDWVYDLIAKYRYDWFGQRDRCRTPTPELRERFLD